MRKFSGSLPTSPNRQRHSDAARLRMSAEQTRCSGASKPLCYRLVPAVTAPHSLTYGRGACGVYNRLSELKAMGPCNSGFELPDHQESERIVCGGAPQTSSLRYGE